jgi:hypothetical protein
MRANLISAVVPLAAGLVLLILVPGRADAG